MERVDLFQIHFTPELRQSVLPDTARLYEVVPVRETQEQVVLAMAPMRLLEAKLDEYKSLRRELSFSIGREVEFVTADREQIRHYVQRLYGEGG